MARGTNIEKSLDLNYDLGHVKSCIALVVEKGAYTMNSSNDILHTYRISKITGLEFVSMNITLKKIDDSNTNIHIVVTEPVRNDGHAVIINKMIDAFLERFSKALIGAPESEIAQVSAQNSAGCLGVVLALVLFSSFFLYL